MVKFFGQIFAILILMGCQHKTESGPHYLFKDATKATVVAKVGGQEITEKELLEGSEGDLYDLEKRVYDFKMERLQVLMIKKFMEADPQKTGMTNDEYLEKFISKGKKVTDAEVEKFIQEKQIPKEQVSDQLRERVRTYLQGELNKQAVSVWLEEKTKKSPVEIYFKKPMRPRFEVKFDAAASPVLGPPSAAVNIVVFSDFQCPFCAQGHKLLLELQQQYGSKVNLVFKHFPLDFHPQALLAANGAMCAWQQGRPLFWKMAEQLFAHQENLNEAGLKQWAKGAGVKMAEFESCLSQRKLSRLIQSDREQGRALGVKVTPTIFINGQLVMGALPKREFEKMIDQELSR